jgi:hypothetical protein
MDDSSLVAREWGMPQAAQCVSQPPLRERVRHQRSDAYLVNRQSDVYEREGDAGRLG